MREAEAMIEHNNRVIETLTRYIETDIEPHYAIMLNGAWGCGKTYFVREKWLKNLKKKEKYSIITISLFGLKNVEELNEEIARSKIIFEEQIENNETSHVVLDKSKELTNNNIFKGVSSIANKLFESKVGINFNDMTKMFTRDWLSENKDGITKILILDDLERAKMDLIEIFGFISSYIESTGLRVIILSNDTEIKKTEKIRIKETIQTEEITYLEQNGEKAIDNYLNHKDINNNSNAEKVANNKKIIETVKTIDNDKEYMRIREKIIGEILIINADIDDAIAYFFEEMNYEKKQEQLVGPLIREIRTTLGCDNLRIVRQTLMKLQPLLKIVVEVNAYKKYSYEEIEISGIKYSKEEYIIRVCKFFILANMKKVMDKLDPDNLRLSLTIHGYDMYQPLNHQIEEKSLDIWINYIWCGELNKDVIKSAVEKDMEILIPQEIMEKDSIFKLQVGFYDYEKEEFYKLQAKMIDELKNGKYTELAAIIQAYSLLLTFEKYDILDDEVKNIDELFDDIFSSISITNIKGDKNAYDTIDDIEIDFLDYRGYQINSFYDEPRVVKFLEKVKEKYKQTSKKRNSNVINVLVNDIEQGNKKLYKLFDNVEQWQPILEWIGIDNLWKLLDSSNLRYQRRLLSKLNNRYGLNVAGGEERYLAYKSERKILENLLNGYKERYEKAKKDRDNKVFMYSKLKDDAEKISKGFIEKLDKGEAIRINLIEN